MSECTFNGSDVEAGDRASFFKIKIVTARKPRKCIECGGEILKGDKYEHIRGVWGGKWEVMSTCLPCVELRSLLCNWYYGHIWLDLENYFDEITLEMLNNLSPPARNKLVSAIDG